MMRVIHRADFYFHPVIPRPLDRCGHRVLGHAVDQVQRSSAQVACGSANSVNNTMHRKTIVTIEAEIGHGDFGSSANLSGDRKADEIVTFGTLTGAVLSHDARSLSALVFMRNKDRCQAK